MDIKKGDRIEYRMHETFETYRVLRVGKNKAEGQYVVLDSPDFQPFRVRVDDKRLGGLVREETENERQSRIEGARAARKSRQRQLDNHID